MGSHRNPSSSADPATATTGSSGPPPVCSVGSSGAAAVGPLALTLGASATAVDDVCRRCDEALRGSSYPRPAQELLHDMISVLVGGGEVAGGDESAGGGNEGEVTH
ncbi:hypothetical protein ZWY2020_037926 [Hordeum vulgare]|nr:hypothetical protein ZWY2020_037926 [Hordeum vulgare]